MLSSAKLLRLKQDLKNAYLKNVYKHIQGIENLRKVCLFFYITLIIVGIIIAIMAFVYIEQLYTHTDENSRIGFMLHPFIMEIVALIIYSYAISNIPSIYENAFKRYYNILAQSIGFTWSHGGDYATELLSPIKDSKLFAAANKIKYGDKFIGTYNDVKVQILEAKIIDSGYETKPYKIEETNITAQYGYRKTPTTVFKGAIARFDSNRNIPCTTVIKPKIEFVWFDKIFSADKFALLFWGFIGYNIMLCKAPNFIFNLFGGFILLVCIIWFLYDCFIREIEDKKGLQKMELEYSEFEKCYSAYSYSQVEGRYLLTTDFIDRFMNVSRAFGTKKLRCSYVNDCLILAIPSRKNMFEIGNLYVSLKHPRHIDKFIDEIASILCMVDYFKIAKQ